MKQIAVLLLALALHPLATATAAAKPAHRVPWLHVAAAAAAPVEIPWLSAERARLLAEQGHGAVDLVRSYRVSIHRNGVVEKETHQIRQFLTAQGAANEGTVAFDVDASIESATIQRAEVYSAGSGRTTIDPTTIQHLTETRRGLYSDWWEVAIPFPALATDTAAVLFRRHSSDMRNWPLPWSAFFVVQGLLPTERFEATLSWDEGVPKPDWATNDPALQCTVVAPREIHCTAEKLEAIRLDADMSNAPDAIPHLIFAPHQTWAEVGAAVSRLMPKDDGLSDAAVTDILAAAGADARPEERLKALHRFVADEIRYVGMEHATNAVTPQSPAVTLRQRYGDCKDKVSLFLALARRAGLQGHPILVSTLRGPAGLLLPSGAYFDHMIACVDDRIVGERCIDLTATSMPTGQIPEAIEGRAALDFSRSEATPRALPTHELTRAIHVRTETDLLCDGSMDETTVRQFGGSLSANLRTYLHSVPREQSLRWATEEFRTQVSSKAIPEIDFQLPANVEEPAGITTHTKYDGTPMRENIVFTDVDPWLTTYLADLKSENRYYAHTAPGLRLSTRHTYRVCPQWSMGSLGPELDLESRFGALHRTYQRFDNTVIVQTDFEAPRATLAPAELEGFSRFIDRSLILAVQNDRRRRTAIVSEDARRASLIGSPR